ncbi:rod shape-determining protein MreD [Peribacillus sp. SCS-155]|uniref:rod shape-determining protein MreD n=1 Tax=Peribacillus sedimenti TaxID=3115297 RepID=UPI0039065D73
MSRFILPLLALIFFISESMYSNLFAGAFFGNDRILVPRFLMIFISFVTIYASRKWGIYYGLVLGIAFDVVYTEVLGIYTFLFPVLAFLVSKTMKMMHANLLIAALVSLFFVGVLEVAVYEINLLIHVADMNFTEFALNRLVPTLLLNLIFILIVSLPLRMVIEKFSTSRDID